MRILGESVLSSFGKIICMRCRNEKECFIMEKSASDRSQQYTQEEVVASQASESVADQKAKFCQEGEDKDTHCESISSSKDKAKHDSSSKDKAMLDSSNEDKAKHDSSSKDKAKHDSSNEDKAKHNSSSKDKVKHDSSNEDKAKHDLTSEDKAKHDSGSKDKAKHDSSNEDKTRHDSSSKDKAKHNSSNEDKAKHDSSSKDKVKSGSSNEDKAKHDSSSKDKAKYDSGSEDKVKHDSSSEEKTKHDSSNFDKAKHDSSSKDKAKHDSSSEDKAKQDLSSKDKEKHDSSSKDNAKHDSSSEDKAKHDSSNEDKAKHDSSSKDKAKHDSSSKDKAKHDSSSKDKAKHDSSSKDKAKHDSSSKDKVKHGSSNEDKAKHDSSNEDKVKHDSSSKDKAKHDSSSKDKVKHDSSNEDKVKHDSSSKDKAKHNSSNEDKVKHDSSSEDKAKLDSGSKDKAKHDLSSEDKEKHDSSSKNKAKHDSSSKDKAKHDSSSNYSRKKEKSSDKLKNSTSSTEGDKHKSSSSNKHEDKEREESKERSISKHKEGSSGGSGERKKEEKPKSIDRPKDTRDVERDKEKSSDKQQPKQVVDLQPMIKEEPKSPIKEEYSPVKDNFISSVEKEIKQNPESDVDLLLAQRVNQDKQEKAVKRPANDDEDDNGPLARRWEEEEREDGVKWTFLEHKGPVFAPLYEPLPDDVNFYYDGEKIKLSLPAEEVATFYARILDLDYTTRDVFNSNFFKDWRKMMTPEEKSTITDLKKCNFKEMYEYFKAKSEERKNMSKEEKKKIKAQNEAIQKEYGVCMMDGHKEKIGNFKIEPPGLFRGRGDHPKQGMLKMRINPEDVIINCSSDSKIPEPPAGHRWKKVLHNNKVTWLASWTENIQGHTKYVILNATFKLKGEKDLQKYEIARKLHRTVDKIRAHYREDWKSKEMMIQQRAVAMYFIDKLALSVDNEKEEGETADTVGCCSLRVEHIKLHDELDGKESVVEFDFLGKDSIRYYNTVSVDKRVYKNLKLFMDNKQPGDDLFDRLNTSIMNEHLNSLMKGLTAKVFRTYNASKTLQEQLNLLTNPDDPVPVKLLSYNRANRAVAILCHHQLFNAQVETLQMKDENKEIALGTSKLNYLDPRISVAWCKKYNVPLEKIYSETQLMKFSWAINLIEPNFEY